jgi:integrase
VLSRPLWKLWLVFNLIPFGGVAEADVIHWPPDRVSEVLALKWSDVDFERLELHVTRSISLQRVGPCKTKASQNPVPLDPELAEVLLMWRRQCAYPMEDD